MWNVVKSLTSAPHEGAHPSRDPWAIARSITARSGLDRPAAAALTEEIATHLADIASSEERDGHPPSVARARTLERFGDPAAVACQLRRRRFAEDVGWALQCPPLWRPLVAADSCGAMLWIGSLLSVHAPPLRTLISVFCVFAIGQVTLLLGCRLGVRALTRALRDGAPSTEGVFGLLLMIAATCLWLGLMPSTLARSLFLILGGGVGWSAALMTAAAAFGALAVAALLDAIRRPHLA